MSNLDIYNSLFSGNTRVYTHIPHINRSVKQLYIVFNDAGTSVVSTIRPSNSSVKVLPLTVNKFTLMTTNDNLCERDF